MYHDLAMEQNPLFILLFVIAYHQWSILKPQDVFQLLEYQEIPTGGKKIKI